MGSKDDLQKYPAFRYIKGGKLIKLNGVPDYWNIFEIQCHHYIPQNYIKRHPEEFKKIEHLQKLFFLPTQMHMELHCRHSKFEQKYGIKIETLLWREK